MKTNITIKHNAENSIEGVYNYYEITGAKYFNRCKIACGIRLRKGDVFNVYRRQFETDSEGNITRWICDVKYGCEYDGRSKETSLAALDKWLEEYYTTGAGRYNPYKPLA
jgi:hypothetical protein